MKKRSLGAADSAYEVGYRKPPKANLFRKGRTGNPRGKKRGEENLISVFKRIVSKRVKINDGEKVRTIPLAEAVVLKNYQAALQRNPFALSNIYRMAETAGEFVDVTDAKQVGRPIFMPEKVKTTEEFMALFGRNRETK
jgi:hypothetical protein